MDFLLRATRESRGKKKLKHIVILTSRALAIAALVLAVARPLASNGFLSWGGGKLDTVILILDRSSSMESQTGSSEASKREIILQQVQQSMLDLGEAKLILIDSATGQLLSIATPEALSTISQTQATDTAAVIPALLESAIHYVLEHDTGRTEIWLASDMQESSWLPNSGKWSNVRAGLNNLSEQTSLRIIALKKAAQNNVSISLNSAQRVDDELVVEIEIEQDGESSSQGIPLNVSLNNARSSESITLTGDKIKLNKRLSLTGKSGFGYIQLPADSNMRDNTAFFSYGIELPVYSAVVAQKGEAQSYLSLASAPPGYANQQTKIYLPHQPIPWESLSLVIWQAPLPEGDAQQPLIDFINKGGVIAFFPPKDTSETNFLGSSWGLVSKSSAGKYFVVQEWDRKDGPLRNGADGISIPVNKLKAIKRREILTNDTSLANWSNGSALLTRKLHGRGSAYFISSLPDYTWSNLADADVILPLIQRLVHKGNQRFGSGFSTTVGKLPADIAVDQAKRKRLDTATESTPLNAAFEAGIYQFDDRVLAINRPAEESSSETVENEDLNTALADTKFSLFEESGDSNNTFSKQLWQTLLMAMLVFLIIEALLCLAPKRKTSARSI